MANGRLFSLIYDKPPRRFFGEVALAAVKPEIRYLKVWMDPTQPSSLSVQRPEDPSKLRGWLKELHARGLVAGLYEAPCDSKRRESLSGIDAKLPDDYIDLVSQTDGAIVGNWTIWGPNAIRKVALPLANYYVLAESEGKGALLVREGDTEPRLYFVSAESDEVQEIGKSLSLAIDERLGAHHV